MENHIKILGILPRIQYVANGENTTFEFPFAIFKNENIEVYLGDVIQNANTYTVSGAGQTEGGSITFDSAPAQGTVVTIYRNLDIERTTDFQEGGALRANALNYEFDYQTACQQQIADSLNRSMLLPPYAVNTDIDLTLPLPAAGKAIVWNSSGTNLENSTVEVNELESTLLGYKTAAESAATTATIKAGIASDKADIATQKAAEAVSTLSDKADKDMDNLSATGKSSIVALAMPDYSAGVSVATTAGTTYTATTDGIFVGLGNASNAGSYVRFYVRDSNDTEIGRFGNYSPIRSGDTVSASCIVPLPKGYKIEMIAATNATCTFYPMKGV